MTQLSKLTTLFFIQFLGNIYLDNQKITQEFMSKSFFNQYFLHINPFFYNHTTHNTGLLPSFSTLERLPEFAYRLLSGCEASLGNVVGPALRLLALAQLQRSLPDYLQLFYRLHRANRNQNIAI